MGKKSKKKRQICHTQADGSRAMDSRPAAMDVLSTWSADSAPSLPLHGGHGAFGHQCSRGLAAFMCRTEDKNWESGCRLPDAPGPSTVGGLPGYQLTAYDAGLRKTTLRGPEGLRGYAASTRHFINDNDLEVDVEEVSNDEERGAGLLQVRAIVVEDEDVPSEPVAKKPKTASARSCSRTS